MTRTSALACALSALVALSGCALTQENDGQKKTTTSRKIDVESSADACKMSASTAPSGRLAFKVRNSGSQVTEFYLYAENGTRIIGEVENVGPGLSRELVVTAAPGKYVTACKPGMKGSGIRADFTVTDSGEKVAVEGVSEADLEEASERYAAYVKHETDALVAETRRFVAAYRAGDGARARALYPTARVHWERIEPVAESFGDLDPKIDLREADLARGQEWTGWHKLEKDLWPPASSYRPLGQAARTRVADQLLSDTAVLQSRVQTQEYSIDQIGNGAKELLDEVASTKITGEEELFSHTDLHDISANVDGAKAAFEAVEDMLRVKDAELYEQIEEAFDALEEKIDVYRRGAGFVAYDQVDEAERKQLSDAVNALAEPLSKLTGVLTS